ncbi:MAG: VCBS repeat-containing protein [Candidatus Eisenbacteria bacterium]|nr:VCBS repeat-containing protein [Candidatus Eisenbacteria bacterium]
MRGHLISLLLLAVGALPMGAANPATLEADVDFSGADVRFESLRAYVRPTIDGCTTIGAEGQPALPVRVMHFVIPADATVESVGAVFGEGELVGTHRVAPIQPEAPIGETVAWVDPDAEVYGAEGLFPPERVVYLGDGYMCGHRVAAIAVYPLQYEPRTGKLRLARDMRVTLSLRPSPYDAATRLRSTPSSSRLHGRAIAALVENAADIERFAPRSVRIDDDSGARGFQPRYAPSLEGSAVEYVIITNQTLKPYFDVLAEWRTKMGLPSAVRTVSWIDQNYPGGCDTAERIRMFITDAYATWGTTYVLLGGDTDIVPPRYCFTTYYGSSFVPGDIYYSSLEGNWNANQNSSFGEGYRGYTNQGDDVDFYPEVFVGRAPVNSALKAANFVAKTLAYEKTPASVMTDRNLYLAEVLFPYDWQGGAYSLDGAADIVEAGMDSVPGGVRGARVYANHTQFPGSYPLGAQAAIDSITRGYNVVVHVGHGNKDVMRMNLNNYVMMNHVDALANGQSRSGFWWLLNCTSAAIDFDCIAERAVNNPNGGASSLFGPTRYAFPATCRDYYWDWLGVLYNTSVNAAGATCALAKARHASFGESGYENTDRWTQLSMVYLGDPALPLWTARPKPLFVSHPGTLQVGASGMSFTVTDPSAVAGAVVCVRKGTEVYARGETGPTGQLTLSFTPRTTGTLTVTVTAANHLPYEATVSVTAASGPHVYAESWSVDDDALGLSIGNGNGKAEASETIELDVTVRNTGVSTATAVTGTLTSLDPYVVIQDGSANFGTIAAGAPSTVGEAFRVAILGTCPNEHDVEFSLQLSEGTRLIWNQTLVCRVFRPNPMQVYLDVVELEGNGNGVIEVGETIALSVDVLNDGNGDAKSLTGKLRYPGSEVAVSDSVDSWGDVPAGSIVSGSGGFVFTLHSAPTRRMVLALSDTYGKTWSSGLDFAAPAATDSLGGKVKGTTIELSWRPVAAPDLKGYDVYRATALAGPYVKATAALTGRTSYFANKGLDENRLYHFYVVAVDSSGHVGSACPVLSISTNPPSQIGWPLATGGGMYSSPAAVDVDGDGDLEIIIASEEIYAWHHTGSELLDGDGDPRTAGILAAQGQGGYRASVAVGEVDGDPGLEVVCAAWTNVGTPQSPAYQVFAWNAENGTVLPGWPVTTTRFCWASPALADLDRDGRAEILIPCADGFLYCWRHNGTEYIDGDNNPLTIGVFKWLGATWPYGSPAVADIDGDGELEIIQPGADGKIYALNANGTTVPGWPFNCEAKSVCSPAVGDVNNDGLLEIAVASNAGKHWLLRANGTVMPGWPKSLYIDGDFPPSPVLADVNGDGNLEYIQVSSDGRITVRDYLGTMLPGWPQLMGASCGSSPVVADIDGDPGMEIVIGCDSGRLYAYDANGALLAGWPIQTDAEIYGSPTVADLDGDGDVEVVIGSMDGNVYVWDCAGQYAGGDRVQWGSFLHDAWRTQNYSFSIPVGVDDGDDTSELQAGPVLAQNCPNPFNPVTTIAFHVPDSDGQAPVRVTIHALDGSVVRTLVDEHLDSGRHVRVWDGKDDHGFRSASGVYFCRLTVGEVARVRKMTLIK